MACFIWLENSTFKSQIYYLEKFNLSNLATITYAITSSALIYHNLKKFSFQHIIIVFSFLLLGLIAPHLVPANSYSPIEFKIISLITVGHFSFFILLTILTKMSSNLRSPNTAGHT